MRRRQFEAHLKDGKRILVETVETAGGWVASAAGYPDSGTRETAQKAADAMEQFRRDREL